MELEKAGEIALMLPELPHGTVAIGRLQSIRVFTWIAAHKARIAQCVADSRALSARFYHACHACA